jgi:hypothetical protein
MARLIGMKHGFKITMLILILPLFVLGQSRTAKHKSTPVAKILRPVLQKIKNQANAPIFLPSELPTSVNTDEIHVVDGESKTDGWEISLFYKPGCGDACFAGFFEAKRGERVSRDDVDKIVRLTHGTRGYYTARSCGGSCTPPQINWVYKGVLYTIQFNVNNKTKKLDEAEIIALANSAIRGGAR